MESIFYLLAMAGVVSYLVTLFRLSVLVHEAAQHINVHNTFESKMMFISTAFFIPLGIAWVFSWTYTSDGVSFVRFALLLLGIAALSMGPLNIYERVLDHRFPAHERQSI